MTKEFGLLGVVLMGACFVVLPLSRTHTHPPSCTYTHRHTPTHLSLPQTRQLGNKSPRPHTTVQDHVQSGEGSFYPRRDGAERNHIRDEQTKCADGAETEFHRTRPNQKNLNSSSCGDCMTYQRWMYDTFTTLVSISFQTPLPFTTAFSPITPQSPTCILHLPPSIPANCGDGEG